MKTLRLGQSRLLGRSKQIKKDSPLIVKAGRRAVVPRTGLLLWDVGGKSPLTDAARNGLASIFHSRSRSDIGGYIFGKIFKGPKLTSISPKKTISGSIGSFILTFLVIGILMFYFTGKLNFKIFVLSFFISFACQLGDLFFSFLKRKAKVKDTGDILPGHGGLLDRIDGMLLAIPLGVIIWKFLINVT